MDWVIVAYLGLMLWCVDNLIGILAQDTFTTTKSVEKMAIRDSKAIKERWERQNAYAQDIYEAHRKALAEWEAAKEALANHRAKWKGLEAEQKEE